MMARIGKIESIQGVRGICAIIVLLSHINCMPVSGAMGVAFFFMISGFVMMLSTENSSTIKAKDYFLKRIIRLVPLYWLLTLFVYVLATINPGWFKNTIAEIPYLLKSFFFVPYEYSTIVHDGPLLRNGWTINVEVLFYILFFLSMKIKHQYRGAICSGIIIVFVGIQSIFQIPSPFMRGWFSFSTLYFAVGMMVFMLWKTLSQHRQFSFHRIIEVLKFPVLSVLFLLLSLVYREGALGLIVCALVFTAIVLTNHNGHYQRGFLFLGDISFSVYLIHPFVVLGVSRLIYPLEELNLTTILISIVCIILSVLAGSVSWFIVEKHFTNFLKHKLFKPSYQETDGLKKAS
ncbi:acyltransferase family protein [Solibaculum mannosilyticum]|uniref:Acyltransferase n=1 Tax=Solibaculum mannosilyticum TaxID=2780922 RepID=A0A7I8D0A9_9FIRM|nr:acyltransferase [Solibaculum mannosilyticum]MCO7138254.1 acyltransferase [[Clostridium] leptum]BCI60208.1 acyltransferase [Solibaculum mannosilyticum]CZT55129.1 Acyltransferase family protein [Eubacteriaceae bacterium CHKCI005]